MAKINELEQVATLKQDLSGDEKLQFDAQFAGQRKKPDTAFILSILMGNWGVDRFYIGQTGLGFLKLLTIGGVLIWAIIDLFIIRNAARRKNVAIAGDIHNAIVESRVSPTEVTKGK